MIKYGCFLACAWMLFFTVGCHSSRQKIPDVSGIKMQVTIHRFDREFMGLDTNAIVPGLSALNKSYPGFLPVYLEMVMNFGVYPDSTGMTGKHVVDFIKGRDIRLLQDTINAHFPQLNTLQNELTQGFRYIKYYFPDFHAPKVVTFISGLSNYGAITVDSVLGIGLDMFLGADFKPYTELGNPYPGYMLYQFSKEFIAADCFKVLEQQMYPIQNNGTLLDQMIAYGKQLYFLDKVMPSSEDYLKIGYTPEQIKWCIQNQQYIWQYFVQNNLLYIHEMQKIMHYIGPGPNTQGMPAESPGNIGSWIGWQIVRKYMDTHSGTSLAQLMKMTDSQLLLSQARYRPH